MKRWRVETIINKRVDPTGGFIEEEIEIEVPEETQELNKITGQTWDRCVKCFHVAPQTEMGYINGKPYCYKYDCYQDRIVELNKGEL